MSVTFSFFRAILHWHSSPLASQDPSDWGFSDDCADDDCQDDWAENNIRTTGPFGLKVEFDLSQDIEDKLRLRSVRLRKFSLNGRRDDL